MHAVFGAPDRNQFQHPCPREFAKATLGPSLESLENRLSGRAADNLEAVSLALWKDLLMPALEVQSDTEGEIFKTECE